VIAQINAVASELRMMLATFSAHCDCIYVLARIRREQNERSSLSRRMGRRSFRCRRTARNKNGNAITKGGLARALRIK